MMVHEAGPNFVFTELRNATGILYADDGSVVSWPDWNPLHCVYCTSIYTAVLMLLAPRWMRRALAISAVAVLIESAFIEAQPGEPP